MDDFFKLKVEFYWGYGQFLKTNFSNYGQHKVIYEILSELSDPFTFYLTKNHWELTCTVT